MSLSEEDKENMSSSSNKNTILVHNYWLSSLKEGDKLKHENEKATVIEAFTDNSKKLKIRLDKYDTDGWDTIIQPTNETWHQCKPLNDTYPDPTKFKVIPGVVDDETKPKTKVEVPVLPQITDNVDDKMKEYQKKFPKNNDNENNSSGGMIKSRRSGRSKVLDMIKSTDPTTTWGSSSLNNYRGLLTSKRDDNSDEMDVDDEKHDNNSDSDTSNNNNNNLRGLDDSDNDSGEDRLNLFSRRYHTRSSKHMTTGIKPRNPPKWVRKLQEGKSNHLQLNKPIGLNNLGNTCFMDSTLQALLNTQCLRDYFLVPGKGKWYSELNVDNPIGHNGIVAYNFGVLLRDACELHTENKSYSSPSLSPYMVHKNLINNLRAFSDYRQHDAQEFLTNYLDGLHEDLNKVKNKPYIEIPDYDNFVENYLKENNINNNNDDNDIYKFEYQKMFGRARDEMHKKRNQSYIQDEFNGWIRSTVVCPECKFVAVTFDPYMYLLLPVKSFVHAKKQRKKWRTRQNYRSANLYSTFSSRYNTNNYSYSSSSKYSIRDDKDDDETMMTWVSPRELNIPPFPISFLTHFGINSGPSIISVSENINSAISDLNKNIKKYNKAYNTQHKTYNIKTTLDNPYNPQEYIFFQGDNFINQELAERGEEHRSTNVTDFDSKEWNQYTNLIVTPLNNTYKMYRKALRYFLVHFFVPPSNETKETSYPTVSRAVILPLQTALKVGSNSQTLYNKLLDKIIQAVKSIVDDPNIVEKETIKNLIKCEIWNKKDDDKKINENDYPQLTVEYIEEQWKIFEKMVKNRKIYKLLSELEQDIYGELDDKEMDCKDLFCRKVLKLYVKLDKTLYESFRKFRVKQDEFGQKLNDFIERGCKTIDEIKNEKHNNNNNDENKTDDDNTKTTDNKDDNNKTTEDNDKNKKENKIQIDEVKTHDKKENNNNNDKPNETTLTSINEDPNEDGFNSQPEGEWGGDINYDHLGEEGIQTEDLENSKRLHSEFNNKTSDDDNNENDNDENNNDNNSDEDSEEEKNPILKHWSNKLPKSFKPHLNYNSTVDKVRECFGLYLEKEVLDNNNVWNCKKCKKPRNGSKKFDIWTLPNHLVVGLKRFTSQYGWQKVTTDVEFPAKNLDLTELVHSLSEEERKLPQNKFIYDLYAVVHHSGSLNFGHYTACVLYGKDWYHISDSYVSKTNKNNIFGPTSYILFYKRRKMSLKTKKSNNNNNNSNNNDNNDPNKS